MPVIVNIATTAVQAIFCADINRLQQVADSLLKELENKQNYYKSPAIKDQLSVFQIQDNFEPISEAQSTKLYRAKADCSSQVHIAGHTKEYLDCIPEIYFVAILRQRGDVSRTEENCKDMLQTRTDKDDATLYEFVEVIPVQLLFFFCPDLIYLKEEVLMVLSEIVVVLLLGLQIRLNIDKVRVILPVRPQIIQGLRTAVLQQLVEAMARYPPTSRTHQPKKLISYTVVDYYQIVTFENSPSIHIIFITTTMKINLLALAIILIASLTHTAASATVPTQQASEEIMEVKKILAGRTLLGKWKLTDDSNFRINSQTTMINQQSERTKRSSSLFNFFQTSAIIREVQGFFEAEEIDGEPTSLYLKLIDGKYVANSTVILQIPLDSQMKSGETQDKGYTLWSSSQRKFVTCLLIRDGSIIGKFNVNADIQITTNIKAEEEVNSSSKIWLKFESGSFSFYVEMKPATDEYNPLIQLVVACTIFFAIAVVSFKPKKTVYNISEWMIVQVAAFVVGTSFILLGESFSKLDTNMKWVAVCCFMNVGSTLLFLRNYEDVVFNQFNNQKKAAYLLAYLSIYFVLVYIFYMNLVFWIYEAFFLLAVQMSYSYSMGGRGGMAIKLVITIVITRIPFIFYRFYFEVLTRYPNNAKLLLTFIGICIIMLTFITLQRYFGSRFLIPKELIPDYFNYFQRQTNPDILKEVCPICTLALGEEEHSKGSQGNHFNDSSLSNQGPINKKEVEMISVESEREEHLLMVTPCEHRFHRSCLMDWMDKRLNCPICRATLPPSEQQRDDSYCC